MTQAQLAELVGVEQATISRIESGRRGVSSETMQELARVLRVSPAEFFEPPAKYARVYAAIERLPEPQREAAITALEAFVAGLLGQPPLR